MQRWLGAWLEAEQGRFALWLPVTMVAGAVWYLSAGAEPAWWVGPGLAGLGVALALRPPARPVGLLLLALGLGFASAQSAAWRAPRLVELPGRATLVEGRVAAVDVLAEGRRVMLEQPRLDGGATLPRSLRIRLRRGDVGEIATGDRLQLRAVLMPPAPPAWPGGWDLQRDDFFAGIGGYGYALGPAEVLRHGRPAGLGGWMQRAREAIGARISADLAAQGATVAAIATTLLTGSTHGIAEADRAAFRNSGLAHLLAIAGLHIGIVMGLAFGATRLGLAAWEYAALRWPTKQLAALAALAAGGLYLLLTGAHVPILRSFAMACLVTLGVLAGRRALSLRGLGLAMAAVVLLQPQAVVGVSFQMSFGAVLALIAGYEALRPWFARLRGDGGWRRRMLHHGAALVVTSALAGSASAPFGAYHFGHVQLYFVVANLVAVPLVAVWVMPAGMLGLLLMPLHLEALALVPMGWGIQAVLWVARTVAGWPAAVLAAPHMAGWGLALLALGMAWLGIWRSRLRLLGIAGIVLGLASPWLDRPPDLLVSADARLVGEHGPAGTFIEAAKGASDFTRDAWLQLWAVEQAGPIPGCTATHCLLRPRPGAVPAMLLRGPGDAQACQAALVISSEPTSLPCRDKVIDRFSVYRDGAYAVWLERDGALVLSDRTARGERPWVIPLPTRTRIPKGVKLTPALAEVLPDG